MASCDGVGSWMYGFAPLEADGDERDVHWASVSVPWANLNFAFYAWLRYKLARVLPRIDEGEWAIGKRTNVADIPGYPTRKLLLGFPSTLTNAAMFSAGGPLRGLAPKKGLRQRAVTAVKVHSSVVFELSSGVRVEKSSR